MCLLKYPAVKYIQFWLLTKKKSRFGHNAGNKPFAVSSLSETFVKIVALMERLEVQAVPDRLPHQVHQVVDQLKILSAFSQPLVHSDLCACNTKRDFCLIWSRSKEFVLVFGKRTPIKCGANGSPNTWQVEDPKHSKGGEEAYKQFWKHLHWLFSNDQFLSIVYLICIHLFWIGLQIKAVLPQLFLA